MASSPATVTDIGVDRVFIGSAPSRLDDLRAAAHLVEGKHVAKSIKQALIVPGSRGSKPRRKRRPRQDFHRSRIEWRDAGCSMCIGMNADVLPPHERSASTSNRNFEGRQGRDSRAPRQPRHGRRRRPRWTLRRCPSSTWNTSNERALLSKSS